MADPITIFQVVSASASLAMQCAQVAKGLHDLAGKFKTAEISILSTAHELGIIRLAWERIESVLQSWEESDAADLDLLMELRLKLEFGSLIVSSLANDIDTFFKRPFSLLQRTKYVWNEETFRGHQERIRDQVAAMNLLVSALNLPTAPARRDLLQQGASVLRQSDESAMSIVPSRLSSRLSSIINNGSRISRESAELVYQQLSIDDDLFTARVYKRNYRHSLLFKNDKGLAPGKQPLTKSSESVHTTDLDLPDQPLRPITRQTRDPNANGFSMPFGTGGKPLQAYNDDAGFSEGHEFVSRAQWNIEGLYWVTRKFVIGPAVTPHLHECYLKNVEPYHMKNFVARIKSVELHDILCLVGNEYRIWRTCLLLEACYQNRDYLVKVLLHDSTIIDGLWREVPKQGVIATHNPLQLAVKAESPGLVSLLLDKGASHDVVKLEGWIDMQQASFGGADLVFDPMKISILFFAADSFQFGMVDVLLEKGLDVNARYPDPKNSTALHRVVRYIALGLCECIRSIEPTFGQSCRKVQTASVLLKHGADPLAQDFDGNNIYHLSALHAQTISHCLQTVLFETMEKHGLLGLYARNSYGKTPYQVAMEENNHAIANIFKSKDTAARHRRMWSKEEIIFDIRKIFSEDDQTAA